ncbi:hypothetical protein MMC25_004663 [Agyrium rufum]|nr:hypothetical protein [Agyrium rufum]
MASMDARKGNRERVVILGSGWAGYILSRQLSAEKYQTVVVSPRSYFVFTPLLNSTAVGTLEFRTTLEPIRDRRYPHIEFVQGWADDLSMSDQVVRVEESVSSYEQARAATGDRYEKHTEREEREEKSDKKQQGRMIDIKYDKLVVSVGCYSQTFGTEGVKENAFFLKDIGDARRIRQRILECYEIASLPTTTDALRKHLLHFCIVGGGPTGMTFGAELSDLVNGDMVKTYPHLKKFSQISVYDVAPTVLNMFDQSLHEYAVKAFHRQQIRIKTSHHVELLRKGLPKEDSDLQDADVVGADGCFTLRTKEEGETGVGLCVWTTGNMMNPFIQKSMEKCHAYPSGQASLTSTGIDESEKQHMREDPDKEEWFIKKDGKTDAILVDDHLRLQLRTRLSDNKMGSKKEEDKDESEPRHTAVVRNVFALGDNAMLESGALPPTAQTANQQAIWLGKRLNKGDLDTTPGFSYKDMGVMTYLGNSQGLVQQGDGDSSAKKRIKGRTAWLVWKGAWLTMSVSWRNRILIVVYWTLNALFGRDISRF